MAGLGGDGFWLIAEADGKVHGINASGPKCAGRNASERSAILEKDDVQAELGNVIGEGCCGWVR